ncbi:hypothetical protein HYT84_02080 [Candidatus Micrarchaeota archaeon]|nr:hypothetical protein [Candidatus Micrarchaeota archaeon]
MQNVKGQSSVEMLVTVGAVIAFTIPVILLLLSLTQYGQESAAIYQAQATSKIIAESINEVYIQGPGAEKNILVTFPSNSIGLSIKGPVEQDKQLGSEVIITMKSSTGSYDAVTPTFARVELLPLLSPNGLVSLKLLTKADGEVQVIKE